MKITYAPDGDGTVVEIQVPDLDVGIVGEIKTELKPALGEAKRVIIDLEKVRFIDSSGAGLLLWIWRQTQASGSQLVLCGLSDQVRLVLDCLKMTRIFTIARNQADALRRTHDAEIREDD